MTNKKNRFFTLIFSCCPGAGEMYLGLYRHGVSLMVAFFGTAALAFWMNWEELLLLFCPVLWCYSFFHTHNLRGMTEEAFAEVKDGFFFENYVDCKTGWEITEKQRRFCGIVLLLIGITMVWRTAFDLIGRFFQMHEIFWQMGYSIPQIAMAGLILFLSLRLMRTPKEEETEEPQEDEIEEKTEQA